MKQVPMPIKGFGINADAARLDNNLDTLARDLEYFAGLGFEYVEIPVHGVGAMIGGRLLPPRVEEICRLLARFPFRYTVHAPNPLNLMDIENLFWQKQAFKESLEFAAAIGSEVLVYHSGRYVPEETFHLPGGRQNLSPEVRDEMRRQEREALLDLAERAKQLGITIAMENARPYLDGSPYCYAEHLSLLVEQVKAIGHPQVGITLDVGHAYLSARHYGFDFLGAVALAAPYVRHVHLHDNFGRISGSLEKKQAELMAAGRGDLHLPIGFGEIPVADVLALLRDYSGVIIHEIRPRYRGWAGTALERGRQLVACCY
ncbi:sugar phosphate isomerase/epimerase family protein [Desulfofundulus kuznetsovii]|uniref:sugar phosphate isomerase/epimerase family protein n=1 Tax=Desulfofundulus kuznetsovii TaxID=58135 RepID=UPI0033906DE8